MGRPPHHVRGTNPSLLRGHKNGTPAPSDSLALDAYTHETQTLEKKGVLHRSIRLSRYIYAPMHL